MGDRLKESRASGLPQAGVGLTVRTSIDLEVFAAQPKAS
jgi:hypothetical protein